MSATSIDTVLFDEQQLDEIPIIDRLVVVDADEFMTEEIPEREVLMSGPTDPLLYRQSINQIFAWRGTGKTLLALAMSRSLATGSEFLKWKCEKPRRVLYIEGELPQKQMQTRVKTVVGQTNGYLKIVTLDKQVKNLIPPLHTAEGQKLVETLVIEHETEVLVLDSISTLTTFATNDEDNWLFFLRWLIILRSRGLCVIVLHHAGKSGMQRGHSRSEDPLDVSIRLSRPADYRPSEGLRCVLNFDKTREKCADADSLNIQLTSTNGTARWVFSASEETQRHKVLSLLKKGMSLRDIAEMTEVPKSTVARWKRTQSTASLIQEQATNEQSF